MDEENDREKSSAVRNTRRIELLFWRTCGLNAIGLIVSWLILKPEVDFGNPLSFVALVFAIWLLDWILKPLLVVCTLPFIVLTFGAGMVFINALVILAAAWIVPGITFGGYGNALIASLLVSALSWGVALAESERVVRRTMKNSQRDESKQKGDDDAIDV